MHFTFDNERPIWLQIAETLRQEIVSGRLQAEEKLPSVRELAVSAKVNPNTVQKAYAQLEREELVYTRRGSGKYVKAQSVSLKSWRQEAARQKIRLFLEEMRQLGLEREEWKRLLEEEENNGNS